MVLVGNSSVFSQKTRTTARKFAVPQLGTRGFQQKSKERFGMLHAVLKVENLPGKFRVETRDVSTEGMI